MNESLSRYVVNMIIVILSFSHSSRIVVSFMAQEFRGTRMPLILCCEYKRRLLDKLVSARVSVTVDVHVAVHTPVVLIFLRYLMTVSLQFGDIHFLKTYIANT